MRIAQIKIGQDLYNLSDELKWTGRTGKTLNQIRTFTDAMQMTKSLYDPDPARALVDGVTLAFNGQLIYIEPQPQYDEGVVF